MKKTLFIIMAFAFCVFMFGCSNKVENNQEENVQKTVITSNPAPDVKKVFEGSEFESNVSKNGFFYRIRNFNESSYDDYVTECKNNGFITDYEGENELWKMYDAQSEDGQFTMLVTYTFEDNYIDIQSYVIKK